MVADFKKVLNRIHCSVTDTEHGAWVRKLCSCGHHLVSTAVLLRASRARPPAAPRGLGPCPHASSRSTPIIQDVCTPNCAPLAAVAMALSRLAFLAHPAGAPFRRPRVRPAVHRCRPPCPGAATVVASTAGRQVQQTSSSSSSSLSSSSPLPTSSSAAAPPPFPSRSTAPVLTDRERVLQRQASIAGTHWARALRAGDTVVDATCGRGRDTLRLAQMLALASSHGTAGTGADGDPYAGGRVVAIDIQVRLSHCSRSSMLISLRGGLLGGSRPCWGVLHWRTTACRCTCFRRCSSRGGWSVQASCADLPCVVSRLYLSGLCMVHYVLLPSV